MTLPYFTITPVNLGQLHVELSNLIHRRYLGEKGPIPTIMWVVQGQGQVIIVDTGTGDPDIVRDRFGRRVDQQVRPNEALEAIGIDSKRVRTVVVTHLHWDHSGNLDIFPNATIYVQRAEVQWAIAPPPADAPHYEFLHGMGNLPRWLDSLRRMKILDGDTQLLPGLRLVHLPGHTPGIMGVQVETAAGSCLIASDAAPLYENWEEEVPPGLYFDIRECYKSYARIRSLADGIRLLPGHDLRVFEQPVYGIRR